MKRGLTGKYTVISTVGNEMAKAFVPNPLPPDPALEMTPELQEQIHSALVSLGRLDSVSTLLPDTDLFLYSYIRKEAVLSSQIEGTQSSLSDLLLFELNEIPNVPLDDVKEVSSYVAALEYGLRQIKKDFPLSNRLIREIHSILLKKGRGSDKDPGEFRQSQNWLGGTRPGNAIFVPPPVDQVMPCMSDLEKFLHNKPSKTPVLLKAAYSHAQFETIHPFLDGNGRMGRLLITLLFCVEGLLHKPLLYLSLYLKEHRQEYYDLLQNVRVEGDWESWLMFFAHAVETTAEESVETAQKLIRLFDKDREAIKQLKKGANSALRVHEELSQRPFASIKFLKRKTRFTVATVTAALKRLMNIGIVEEVTGQRRNRIFVYKKYLKLLE